MQKEAIDNHWNEVLEVVAKIEARNENLVIVGDLNRAIGPIVPGYNARVSYGGKLVNSLLENEKYVLLNSLEKVIGGPWTREDPANPDSKSVLDLVIVSKGLEKYVQTMEIDSKRSFTPFKQKNGSSLSFPDHYALSVMFKGIPLKIVNNNLTKKKFTRWNTNKVNRWKRYNELTSNNSKLEEIARSNEEDPNVIMNSIEKELNSVKFIAFGKVKVREKTLNKDKIFGDAVLVQMWGRLF